MGFRDDGATWLQRLGLVESNERPNTEFERYKTAAEQAEPAANGAGLALRNELLFAGAAAARGQNAAAKRGSTTQQQNIAAPQRHHSVTTAAQPQTSQRRRRRGGAADAPPRTDDQEEGLSLRGAGRGTAAGRDVDIPRATDERARAGEDGDWLKKLPPSEQAQAARAPRPEATTARTARRLDALANFSLTPRDLKARLDQHVVGQHEAKRALAVALADHFQHARACVRDPRRLREPHVRRAAISSTRRGDAAAATWIFLWRIAAAPRPRRGYFSGASRRRRGRDVDILRRRVATTPRPRRG